MAQALDQILASLNPVYDPLKASNQQQQDAIAPQQNADLSGLNATKQSAFSDITTQANRNGLFYSGLPIAEEQKYVGGTYLPAVANLQAKYQQQRFSLQDALAKIKSDQYNQAYGIQSDQMKQEEAAREFDRQLAAQQAAAAANRAAAGSGASFGNLGSVLGANTSTPQTSIQDQAYRSVQSFANQGEAAIRSDYQATLNSARRGNQMDQLKIQLYQQEFPQYFGATGIPNSPALGFSSTPSTIRLNGGGLSY